MSVNESRWIPSSTVASQSWSYHTLQYSIGDNDTPQCPIFVRYHFSVDACGYPIPLFRSI